MPLGGQFGPTAAEQMGVSTIRAPRAFEISNGKLIQGFYTLETYKVCISGSSSSVAYLSVGKLVQQCCILNAMSRHFQKSVRAGLVGPLCNVQVTGSPSLHA
jgi:hypothetical protein